MIDFVAIDFETGNQHRVSACALGYAKVSKGEIVESNGFLFNPVGGHASFQSKIHGIKDEHTRDKPSFGDFFSTISDLFSYPLVGHSLFDKQVLNALFSYYNIDMCFDYTDSSAVAKNRLPMLSNHKLQSLAKHFNLPQFKHHDATEDAMTCARIFLKLQNDFDEDIKPLPLSDIFEFKGLARGILADDEVNYKEAYELLYWLDDHSDFAAHYSDLYLNIKSILADDILDNDEAEVIKNILKQTSYNLFQTGI